VQPIIQDQYRNSLSGPHQNIARTSAPYWLVSYHVHSCTHHPYFNSRIFSYITIHNKVPLFNHDSQILDYLTTFFNYYELHITIEFTVFRDVTQCRLVKGISRNLSYSSPGQKTERRRKTKDKLSNGAHSPAHFTLQYIRPILPTRFIALS